MCCLTVSFWAKCGKPGGIAVLVRDLSMFGARLGSTMIASTGRLFDPHDFFKLKRIVVFYKVIWPFRSVRIATELIEVLNDLETTLIDVEVDVPLLEVRGVRLPRHGFGISLLNSEPSL